MRERTLPIAPEGWVFILPPLLLAVVLVSVGWRKSAALGVLIGLFMAFFFRDPERTVPVVEGAVLAPADGRVLDVRPRVDDPFVGAAQQVAIFLSPLDVHVNRSPLAGLVVDVEHILGGYRPAYDREGSETNEQTRIALQGETARVVVRQIAGVLARRIVCRVRPGDKLGAGERFGLIKFGSRTDVVLPVAARIQVKPGDRVRGGETVLGVLP